MGSSGDDPILAFLPAALNAGLQMHPIQSVGGEAYRIPPRIGFLFRTGEQRNKGEVSCSIHSAAPRFSAGTPEFSR